MSGTIYSVSSSGADIVGFDPGRDKLDLGSVSVHNMIVIDTPRGVGFLNPWSGQAQIIVGVSLGQLTIDSFTPIENDHLRQDLSGALAWEHGITPDDGVVYVRSHEVGRVDTVSFDPSTDIIDFRYFGTREQLEMLESPQGVMIRTTATGQTIVLEGVALSDLSPENFVFHAPQVREDRLHQQLGWPSIPDSQILGREEVMTAGTMLWPTQAGPGPAPSGQTGTTIAIEWDYGSHKILGFDPTVDVLDFGWFKAHEFNIEEVAGSVVISISNNQQSYKLQDVSLDQLSIGNIVARDDSARQVWYEALAISPGSGFGEGHEHDHQNHEGYPWPGPTDQPGMDMGTDDPHAEHEAGPSGMTPGEQVAGVSFSVRDNWTTGFVADLQVKAQTPLQDWVISFDANFEITNIWNAQILSHENGRYVIGSSPWNNELDTGESITIGWQAAIAGQTPRIANIVIAAETADGEISVTEPSEPDQPGVEPDPEPQTPPEEPRLPTLSINDISVIESSPGSSTGEQGWLSTRGNQIIDHLGNPVQLAGVNWFGMESQTYAVHGLWARNYQSQMDQMVELGFNTIRLPFSSEMLHTGNPPNGINFALNPDLQGLGPLEILDRIVDYAGEIGLRIILDHHRGPAGAGASANGLWYDQNYPQDQWIADWQMLAARYARHPAVIGGDLHNEPYNGTWGDGSQTDWANAATLAANAIAAVNPNWLIFVEGIGQYGNQNYWWGGNLMGVRDHPIVLDVENKLVYSSHDYPNSVYAQPWFQDPAFEENLPGIFDQMWGFIYREEIAPVLVGEFGTKLEDPKDQPWFDAITRYIGGDFDLDGSSDLAAGQTGMSWTYWSWNPNSGDTGGILADDWHTPLEQKLDYLQPIMADLIVTADGTEPLDDNDWSYAYFTVELDQAADGQIEVDFRTVPATADESDFMALAGTLVFEPGQTRKTVAVAINPDTQSEQNEWFSVVLDNAVGASIHKETGTVTIVDDDSPVEVPEPPSDPVVDVVTPTDNTLDLDLQIESAWGSGFNAAIRITNTSDHTLEDWQFQLDMPYEIGNLWNAQIVSRTDQGYLISSADWNSELRSGQHVEIGFTGIGTGESEHISLFA